jgi:hypothetical protein
MGIIVTLLIIWLVCIVVGFAVKAVVWLAILGIVAFILTVAAGVMHSVRR